MLDAGQMLFDKQKGKCLKCSVRLKGSNQTIVVTLNDCLNSYIIMCCERNQYASAGAAAGAGGHLKAWQNVCYKLTCHSEEVSGPEMYTSTASLHSRKKALVLLKESSKMEEIL